MFDEAVGSGGCLSCVVLCCIESRVDCRNMESKLQILGLVCVWRMVEDDGFVSV